MITLLIKTDFGTNQRRIAEAERLVEEHGMEALTVVKLTSFGEGVVEVADFHIERVVRWFLETNLEQAPFSPGTLLWYNIRNLI